MILAQYMSVLYLRVYMLGMPFILLYNFEAAIFRGSGNTRTPLIALSCSGLINVVLNVFFVVVVGMTVNGVALATVISNLISSSLLFYFLCRTAYISDSYSIIIPIPEMSSTQTFRIQFLKLCTGAGILPFRRMNASQEYRLTGMIGALPSRPPNSTVSPTVFPIAGISRAAVVF